MALSTACGPPNPSQLIANGLMYPLQYDGPSYTRDSFPEELLCIPYEESPDIPCAPCDVKLQKADGIAALLIRGIHRNTPSYLVILFHGNGVDIGLAQKFWRPLVRALPIHLLIVEYPGYGIMGGRCCSDSVRAVADRVYEYCTAEEGLNVPPDRLIIFGRSIGSGPACYLAQRPCCMLCLVSPFSSIRDLSQELVGRLSSALVNCENFFDNMETVEHWKCDNICIIHGVEDEVIRSSHSATLHSRVVEKLPHANTRVCMVQHVGHNNLNIQSHVALKIMLHFRSFFRAGCPCRTPSVNAPAPGLILHDENIVRMIDKVVWDTGDEDFFDEMHGSAFHESLLTSFDDLPIETLHKLHHHRRHSKRHKHKKLESFPDDKEFHPDQHNHHHHRHRHHHHHHHRHHGRRNRDGEGKREMWEHTKSESNLMSDRERKGHRKHGKRARIFHHKHHRGGFYHGGHRNRPEMIFERFHSYSTGTTPQGSAGEESRVDRLESYETGEIETANSAVETAAQQGEFVVHPSRLRELDDSSSGTSSEDESFRKKSRSESDLPLESQSSLSLLWNAFTRR